MRIGLVMLGLLTSSVVIGGKYHWEGEVREVQASAYASHLEVLEGEQAEAEEKAEKERHRLQVLDRINGLPRDVQPLFRKKAAQGKPVRMMIAGSSSTSDEPGAWPDMVKRALTKEYGEEFLSVSVHEIGGKTSRKVIKEGLHLPLAEEKPDLLLLEPFLLADNSRIDLKERLKNLSSILDAFKKENPDVMILLQPPNPIPDAHYYPMEEKKLKEYAKDHHYPYIDHWKAWKDVESQVAKNDLPTKEGNKVWSSFMVDYFVDKSN
ncbi:hypothetical protein RKD55_000562 [Rossellomorea marisflavi]